MSPNRDSSRRKERALDSSGEYGQAGDAVGYLEIFREDGHYADGLRKYRLIVDGADVGSIRAGESKTVATAPGQHTLKLTISRLWRSQVEAFDIAAGQRVAFRCWPRATPATAWWAITDYSRYIRLERVDDLALG
jgi:hypothetical protein